MKTTVIAVVVAVLVASGTATASSWVNGRSIRPDSLPVDRLEGRIPLRRLAKMPSPHLTFTRVVGSQYSISPQQTGFAPAMCPKGQQAIAGGFLIVVEPNPGQILGLASWPLQGLTGWATQFENTGTVPATVQAYAVCVP